jgi:hypothetical protein
MGLVCFIIGLEVPFLLYCVSSGSHMEEKGLGHTRIPDRNTEFCTFANMCHEMVVLEHGNYLLNTFFLGDIWNWKVFV